MKTIGIIGGMSFESTIEYYKIINETINRELGGFNSAKILLYSLNFAEIEALQKEGKWREMGEILSQIALNLQNGGADFIIIATNTMHKVADIVQSKIKIPLFHIIDALCESLNEKNAKKVLFLGTIYSMTQEFYISKLRKNGFEVVLPNESEMREINRIIFDELCFGAIKESSKNFYLSVIKRLKIEQNIDGVILGCTEIPLLISQKDLEISVFDTTKIHAENSALKMIKGKI